MSSFVGYSAALGENSRISSLYATLLSIRRIAVLRRRGLLLRTEYAGSVGLSVCHDRDPCKNGNLVRGLGWVQGTMCYMGNAHLRNLANTIEPSVCGGDAASREMTLTTCYVLKPIGGIPSLGTTCSRRHISSTVPYLCSTRFTASIPRVSMSSFSSFAVQPKHTCVRWSSFALFAILSRRAHVSMTTPSAMSRD